MSIKYNANCKYLDCFITLDKKLDTGADSISSITINSKAQTHKIIHKHLITQLDTHSNITTYHNKSTRITHKAEGYIT